MLKDIKIVNGFSVEQLNSNLFHIKLPDKTLIKQVKSFKDVLMYVFEEEALKKLTHFREISKKQQEIKKRS